MLYVRRALLLAIFGPAAMALLLVGILCIFPIMSLMTLLFEGRVDLKDEWRWMLEAPLEMFQSLWNIEPA